MCAWIRSRLRLNSKGSSPGFSAKVTSVFLAAVWLVAVGVQGAREVRVTNAGELANALKSAKTEQTILLAPGNYGHLKIYAGQDGFTQDAFPETVTVAAANPDDPAVIRGFYLRGVSNLVLEDIAFDDSEGPVDKPERQLKRRKPFQLLDSDAITICDCTFKGRIYVWEDGKYPPLPVGHGLYVRDVGGLTIERSVFRTWNHLAQFMSVDKLRLTGNEFVGARHDAVRMVAIQDALIEGNHFHDFHAIPDVPDHRDMIQFWSRGAARPSTNVTIRGNIFNSGGSVATQSIFVRNEAVDSGRHGRDMFYRNFVVENNLIHNNHPNGIRFGEIDGLTVARNTMLQNRDSRWHPHSEAPPRIIIHADRAENVTIRNNITHGVPEPPEKAKGWDIGSNLIVQNTRPTGANHYDKQFLNATAGSLASLADLQALPGSKANKEGLGAEITQYDPTPPVLTSVARSIKKIHDPATYTCDGSYSAGPDGRISDDEATFHWHFGDDTSVKGRRVQHTFREPGTYRVGLKIELADGRSAAGYARAHVPEPVRLDLDVTTDGLVDSSPYVADSPPALPDVEVVTAAGRRGMRVKEGKRVELSRPAVKAVGDMPGFSISVAFRAEKGKNPTGDILRFHNSLVLNVDKQGRLTFTFKNAGRKTFRVRTPSTSALDGNWHDATVTYDAQEGEMSLFLDGEKLAQGSASGRTKFRECRGLVFGTIWNMPGFVGLIDDVEVRSRPLSPAQVRARHGVK